MALHQTHRGDHVYCRRADGTPVSGKVLAVGEHGCTVEVDGEQHKILWADVLGHKARLKHRVTVVDSGEDGALVEDENGERQYIAMNKAQPPILLLKSGIKNRAGLSLQEVTDKRGNRVHKWKRTAQDEGGDRDTGLEHDERGAARGYGTHDIEPGDAVTFRTKTGRGRGEVVSAGKDGATIRDDHGNQHQVRWLFITGHTGGGDSAAPPTGTGRTKDSPGQTGASGGGDDGGNGNDLKAKIGEILADRRVLGSQEPVSAEKFQAADYFKAHDDGEVTPNDILGLFPDEVREKIKGAQERLKSIEETTELHQENGAYTEEREKLHREIIGKFLNPETVKAARPEDGEKPTFTLLGGRGGSGKSWFKNEVYDPEKAIVIDADAIKENLPEYEGWNAHQVHEESSQLVDRIVGMAQRLGLNIVHDATMKTPKKAVALVNRFKDAGYRVEAHYMHLPRHEAAKRAVARFMGKSGRYVPVSVVLSNTSNEAGFDAVRGLVDAWSFRDNNVEKGADPVLISESGESDESDSSKTSKQPDVPGDTLRKAGLPGLCGTARELPQGAGGPAGGRGHGDGQKGRDYPARLIKALLGRAFQRILLRDPPAKSDPRPPIILLMTKPD